MRVRFLRMKPGHGEVLLAEGDVEVAEDELRLIEEFRSQLDAGSWAAVPQTGGGSLSCAAAHSDQAYSDVRWACGLLRAVCTGTHMSPLRTQWAPNAR